ncbi:unnamed protein product [Linum trigynum]|uniref:Uncharacterized protein n=1 Tax=Linum trigynum TaxID=586398 RepID=A0AAV2E0K4_9ROSI
MPYQPILYILTQKRNSFDRTHSNWIKPLAKFSVTQLNLSWTNHLLHLWDSTLRHHLMIVNRGIGCNCGIQLDCSRRICLPLPTCHCKPLFNNSQPNMILCHCHEGLDRAVASMKVHLRKYFPLYTWESRDSGSLRIRQPILAKRAWLKFSNRRNLIPPSCLLRHIFLQDTHRTRDWPPSKPHQNLAIRLSKRRHRERGSLKQDITCNGRAKATDLINVSFAAQDRVRYFHP